MNSRPQVQLAVGFAILAAITLTAYVPGMQAGFVWDDDKYVTANPTLTSAGGLGRIWLDPSSSPQYYPLVFSSFWLEARLWGLNPGGFHVVNILLHLVNACLLWLLLRGLRVPGAWLAAAIFAVHPVHVESVVWISERKNVLSGMFYLLSMGAYLRFCGLIGRPGGHQSARSRRDYWAALALFLAALLSKTVTATLPAALLLVVWWQRQLRWRELRPLLPFFAVGAAFGIATAVLEHEHVGVKHVDLGISGIERLLVAGRAVWFYLWKLIWPAELTFIYPRFVVDRSQLWQFGFPISAATVVGFLWWMRRRIGRGPLTAALFLGVTLFPALGFIDVFPMIYSWVADHFQYLASIGPIVCFAALAVRGVAALRSRIAGRLGTVAAAGLLVVLGLLTWRQCGAYASLETLWSDTLAKNPNASLAHNNLGVILRERGDLDGAIRHHRAVFEVEPPERDTFALARAHFNLGSEYFLKGWYERALDEYRASLFVEPRYPRAHHGLGVALSQLGRIDEAIEALERAATLEPDNPQIANQLQQARRRLD